MGGIWIAAKGWRTGHEVFLEKAGVDKEGRRIKAAGNTVK